VTGSATFTQGLVDRLLAVEEPAVARTSGSAALSGQRREPGRPRPTLVFVNARDRKRVLSAACREGYTLR